MPRPKPTEPLFQFHAKIPANEAAALVQIVAAWGRSVASALASQGVSVAPPVDRTAWLRSVIHEQAAKYGVPIGDSPPVSAPPKAKRAPKKPTV